MIDATRDAIAAATRANVAIYGIDPRGLGAGFDELIEIPVVPRRHDARPRLERASTSCAWRRTACACCRRDRRLRGGQSATTSRRVPAHRRRQQLVLRARLLLGQRSARRPLPQDRGPGQRAPVAGARARRLRRAARARRRDRPPRPDERRVAGIARGDDQPAAAVGAAAGRRRRRVQGARAERLGRDFDVHRGATLPLVEKDGMFKNDLEIVGSAVDAKGKTLPTAIATP